VPTGHQHFRKIMRTETRVFVADLEKFAGRKLSFPEEIGLLVEAANEGPGRKVLEEAAFHAKFVSKTFDLMKRVGPGAEGFDKLQAELANTLRTTTALLQSLGSKFPDDARVEFEGRFLTPGEEQLTNLMQLVRDLAWVKNWMLDGKTIP
jgi:hypothetical protein